MNTPITFYIENDVLMARESTDEDEKMNQDVIDILENIYCMSKEDIDKIINL